jgi:peptidoglycan/xylan/chitin deacetylase (PgdA/CDA1 family)
MPDYQRYQRFHARPEPKGTKLGKVLVILAILVVLYLIGRAIFGSSQNPTTTFNGGDANSNSAEAVLENSNVNSDANSNTNSNSNTNAAANINTQIVGDFDTTKCQQVYSRGLTTAKNITLTFNVGTSKQGEIQGVLDALKNSSTPADFFARGEVAESNPDLIKKISQAGFPVYNLSYNYPHFNDLPDSGVADQLSKAESAIAPQTGRTTKPFFRPPYGETLDSDILAAVVAAGYCPVTWSVDAMDWSSDYTAEQSKERILSKAANGYIILMQASNSITAEILPGVITKLKEDGYSLVHLEDLLQ